MILTLAFTVGGTAHAQDVLYHYTHNWTQLHPDAEQALLEVGSTGVTQTTTLPASLSGYVLVVLNGNELLSAPTFTPAEVSELQSFLNGGGWLLIQGDNGQFYGSSNTAFNHLLGSLGSSVSFGTSSLGPGCGQQGTLVVPGDPLLTGMTTLEYANTNVLSIGAGATTLVDSSPGMPLIAIDGTIVVSGDTNISIDACPMSFDNRQFLKNLYGEAIGCTDGDGDGYGGMPCGLDCDDADATIHPAAIETWYDGIDQDCDGQSDYDADGDGHDSDAYGGADCDDTDAAVGPGAVEIPGDGVDQDCDGRLGNDLDQDGYDDVNVGGTDCDDTDPAIHPGAPEVWYDGVDQACDGGSDYDQDGDGHDHDAHGGDDCDDLDPTFNPGADEIWYDGVDQDCDGRSDYDQDQDGYDSESHGGDDCDDLDADRHPGAVEIWYDGVDQDCDGASDHDQDGDGYDGGDAGDDCDDTSPDVHPGAIEILDDGIDRDCDGEDEQLPGISGEVVGCGCASSGGPSPTLGGLLLGALGFVRRARRAAARK